MPNSDKSDPLFTCSDTATDAELTAKANCCIFISPKATGTCSALDTWTLPVL